MERAIPVFWDFDLTISDEYQEVALFRRRFPSIQAQAAQEGLSLAEPSDAIQRFTLMPGAIGVNYMERMLRDTREGGCMAGLTDEELRDAGQDVRSAAGFAECLRSLAARFEGRATLHHYIITVGLRPMVEGFLERHGLKPFIAGLSASEFLTDERGVICGIKQVVIPFSKTEWLIGYMKGGQELLNAVVRHDKLKYHYPDVIVIGDGHTDISKFSYVKKLGGTPIGVYAPGDNGAYERAKRTVGERVDHLVPRDYTPGRPTFETLAGIIEEKLSRTCAFNPEVLYLLGRGDLCPELSPAVEAHVRGCAACRGFYHRRFLPPHGEPERVCWAPVADA